LHCPSILISNIPYWSTDIWVKTIISLHSIFWVLASGSKMRFLKKSYSTCPNIFCLSRLWWKAYERCGCENWEWLNHANNYVYIQILNNLHMNIVLGNSWSHVTITILHESIANITFIWRIILIIVHMFYFLKCFQSKFCWMNHFYSFVHVPSFWTSISQHLILYLEHIVNVNKEPVILMWQLKKILHILNSKIWLV
jgi:hypothetical protein